MNSGLIFPFWEKMWLWFMQFLIFFSFIRSIFRPYSIMSSIWRKSRLINLSRELMQPELVKLRSKQEISFPFLKWNSLFKKDLRKFLECLFVSMEDHFSWGLRKKRLINFLIDKAGGNLLLHKINLFCRLHSTNYIYFVDYTLQIWPFLWDSLSLEK